MAGRLLSIAALCLLLGLPVALGGCATIEATRLYSRGTEALEEGRTARAIADLERAAELMPTSGEIHNHLGIAYLQAGRKRDARDAFARAVAYNCSNPAARHNLALLNEELGVRGDAGAARP